jgi:PAS domain S-box-containing protein
MVLRIKQWLAPPVFPQDETKTRRAGLLNLILLVNMGAALLIFLGDLAGGKTPPAVAWTNIVIVAVCLGLRRWMRTGKVKWAGVVLIAFGIMLATGSIAQLGTIRTPSTALFLLAIVVAGLLFDVTGLFIVTGLSSLAVAGLVLAETAGLLPAPDYSVTVTQWGTYTVIFAAGGGLMYYYINTIHLTLVRAEQRITERKQAEEALRALSMRQEAILFAVPDIIMEVNTDKIYTWASPAGIEFFGEDVIGKEAAFYFEGEQAIYETVQPLFNGRDDVIYVESWQRRKDGEKRLLAWQCRTLKDADGNLTGALSSAHDITAHKRMEAELRVQSEIMSHMAEAVYLIRQSDGIIVFANPQFEELFGYGRGEMPGKHVSIVNAQTEKSPEETAQEIMSKLEENGFWSGEVYNIKKNGTTFWSDAKVTIFDHSLFGKVLVSLHRDITERKQAEEALRLSEQTARQMSEQLKMINRIGIEIAAGLDFEQLMQTIYEQCQQIGDTDTFYIALYDDKTDTVSFPFNYKDGERRVLASRNVRKNPGLVGYVIQNRRTFCINDEANIPASITVYKQPGISSRSYITVPLILNERVVGVLSMQSHMPNAYSPEQVQTLELVAIQVAIAIQNAQLYQQAQEEIVERKQAEESLRESEKRYQTLAEISPVGIFRTDAQGLTIYVNQCWCEISGMSADEALGNGWLKAVHPDDHEKLPGTGKRPFRSRPFPDPITAS